MSNDNTLPLPAPPSSRPNHNSNPNARGASNSPEAIAFPAMALSVRGAQARTRINRFLVGAGVDYAPKGGAQGRHHGNDAPVRGEVFYAPYHRDDNWG